MYSVLRGVLYLKRAMHGSRPYIWYARGTLKRLVYKFIEWMWENAAFFCCSRGAIPREWFLVTYLLRSLGQALIDNAVSSMWCVHSLLRGGGWDSADFWWCIFCVLLSCTGCRGFETCQSNWISSLRYFHNHVYALNSSHYLSVYLYSREITMHITKKHYQHIQHIA